MIFFGGGIPMNKIISFNIVMLISFTIYNIISYIILKKPPIYACEEIIHIGVFGIVNILFIRKFMVKK